MRETLPHELKRSWPRNFAPWVMPLSWWFCWPVASAGWAMSMLTTERAPPSKAATENEQV